MVLEVLPNVGAFVTTVQPEGDFVVTKYNRQAAEDRRLAPHDRIVSVNGYTAPSDMSKQLQNSVEATLLVRKPMIFDTKVATNGQPMGLTLHHIEAGHGLYVEGIASDSVITKTGADVVAGDRIVKVNGRAGKSKELLEEVRGKPEVVLTVARITV